jgi:hypothetical protein
VAAVERKGRGMEGGIRTGGLYCTVQSANFDDSASLQSMQWIINAAYNQSSLQSTAFYTA